MKTGLLELVDHAVAQGWPHTRACCLLGVSDVRVHRWRARMASGARLDDQDPGGNPVHRLLAWEEKAILKLVDDWAEVDHSHRKLAHRGSYTGEVFVCPSTLLRVLDRHKITLPGEPPRPPAAAPVLPEVPWERNRIWIWDASHFTRAGRVAYAIVDVVTRYWIDCLVTPEMTSTQVQVLFTQALEGQGLVDPWTGQLLIGSADEAPVLVAWSDNGPEMTSADTRQFMALMSIVQHHGRPGTPTDQAPIESFFSHLKGEWPHLEALRDPQALETELRRIRREYNTVRLHAGIGYVTPDDEHHGRGPAIRRAREAGLKRAREERIENNRKNRPGSTP